MLSGPSIQLRIPATYHARSVDVAIIPTRLESPANSGTAHGQSRAYEFDEPSQRGVVAVFQTQRFVSSMYGPVSSLPTSNVMQILPAF